MAKLRVSIVEYLNTAPLAWGLTEGPLAGRYELSFTVPSQCAEALRRGEADVAIIPAIEYQRMENKVILPGMSVAAKRDVRSILVVSKRPMDRARKVALDASSRSSAALVRLLAREHWGISPEFVEMTPDAEAMLAEADAALIIGDPALGIAVKMDLLAAKVPPAAKGEMCCQGNPEEMPVRGFDTIFVYDVAHEWREMTGKPCVLAVWAGAREKITPEVVADFQASKEYGLARIDEIADAASMKLELPPEALAKYLSENIDYSLDDDNRGGLQLFYEKSAAAGLIPRARCVEFAGEGTPAGAGQLR
ncbi:MAG: menaquinone biosynthetic enzyme MqnA/MqnD family protein [Candidatus Acidiferrales bacterium]